MSCKPEKVYDQRRGRIVAVPKECNFIVANTQRSVQTQTVKYSSMLDTYYVYHTTLVCTRCGKTKVVES